MTKRTIVRLTLTIERIETTDPSGSPFGAARRVIDTTASELGESVASRSAANVRPIAQVLTFRKVG